jgi:hypothetical protein
MAVVGWVAISGDHGVLREGRTTGSGGLASRCLVTIASCGKGAPMAVVGWRLVFAWLFAGGVLVGD